MHDYGDSSQDYKDGLKKAFERTHFPDKGVFESAIQSAYDYGFHYGQIDMERKARAILEIAGSAEKTVEQKERLF